TSAGDIRVLYVYGHDLISQVRGGLGFYYHRDGLGSTRALTDATGAITDRYAFDAFGRLLREIGGTTNPFRFAGEAFEAVSGLSYNRARWLNPAIGRFLSRDAFGGSALDPRTLHRYIYAVGNPVDLTDPSGLYPEGLAGVATQLAIKGGLAGASFGLAIG